jgi:hypothetical protein
MLSTGTVFGFSRIIIAISRNAIAIRISTPYERIKRRAVGESMNLEGSSVITAMLRLLVG